MAIVSTLRCVAVILSAQLLFAFAETLIWTNIPTIADSPTSLEIPPPGCSCVSNDSPCSKFDCGCTCNLHAKACDVNCCCDPECSSAEVARFNTLGTCRASGAVNLTVVNCVDIDIGRSLVYINPKPRMQLEQISGASYILCISVDNNPILGTYISDPGLQDSAVLDRSTVARAWTFLSSAAVPAASSSAVLTSYDPDTRIPVALVADPLTGTLRTAYGGSWSLPVSPGTSECALSGGGTAVGFGSNLPIQQCIVSLPLTQGLCNTLSAARFTTSLRLGLTPAAVSSAPAGFTAPSLTTAWLATTGAGATVTASVAPASDVAASGVWTDSVGGAPCSCANAVVGVSYAVEYSSGTRTLSSVGVSVVLATLTQPAAQCGVAPLSVPFTAQVAFVPDAASLTAIAGSFGASNDLAFGRSGNPGYVVGAPVLSGVRVTADGNAAVNPASSLKVGIARAPPAGALLLRAVAQSSSDSGVGLAVRGPSSEGLCVALNAAAVLAGAADASQPVFLGFGEDLSVSCSLLVTSASLPTLCTPASVAAAITAAIGLAPILLPSGTAIGTPTHIGQYGASSPEKVWQWLALDTIAPNVDSVSYDATTGMCSNVPTSASIQFLAATTGQALNPQARIVAVRVRWFTDTLRVTREDGGAQRLSLRTTVSWTALDPVRTDYVPPTPPVIPPLPSDLFYPFASPISGSDSAAIVTSAAQDAWGGAGVGGRNGALLAGVVIAVITAVLAVL